MDEPKSLDSLFKEKIFRIPDYQRGYAWQKSQLKDFWEDLINLSDDRSHYTGVLTLNEVNPEKITEEDDEYWLVEDYSYKMYHIVDGQQRLITFVVFLQAFIDSVKNLDENSGKSDQEIYITDSLNLEAVISRYLYKTKPSKIQSRAYKFGYKTDKKENNPNDKYLRYKIFNEEGSPSIEETYYTLNLKEAKEFFDEQLKGIRDKSDMSGLREIYKKLTKKFLFNEYVIKNEFDVFVTFETMNNRGKQLSGLELLKNRLIYLTTLYTEDELDSADRGSLREAINDAWKEMYKQLGRNDKRPLNDDDFLKAHWIMYFQHSGNKWDEYITLLLDEQFSPQKIHEKTERKVASESPKERPTDSEIDDSDSDNGSTEDSTTVARLQPDEIKQYVNSLKESAVHWFNSHYPHLATGLSDAEKDALGSLNRIGMGYFRPLLMSVFKKEECPEKRTDLLNHIERFIFIVFRLSRAYSNYGRSEFYNASRKFYRGELTLEGIKQKLDDYARYCFDDDGTFISKFFRDHLYKLFNSGDKGGYYGWSALRYFLYEYELDLLSQSRQKKVAWEDLQKTPGDNVSIEHIFPRNPTDGWKGMFAKVGEKDYPLYSGSIGNLLLLSMSVNSSLQNDDFGAKKAPKSIGAKKIRNGYSDGSHSEIEVSRCEKWTPEEIEKRGLRLLSFMEERWDIKFKDDAAKRSLLFLEAESSDNS